MFCVLLTDTHVACSYLSGPSWGPSVIYLWHNLASKFPIYWHFYIKNLTQNARPIKFQTDWAPSCQVLPELYEKMASARARYYLACQSVHSGHFSQFSHCLWFLLKEHCSNLFKPCHCKEVWNQFQTTSFPLSLFCPLIPESDWSLVQTLWERAVP